MIIYKDGWHRKDAAAVEDAVPQTGTIQCESSLTTETFRERDAT